MKNVRTFADLSATLTKRATAFKVASQKKAGEETGQSPEVPERDDRSKGTVAIPKDPDGATMKTVGLENKTNAEVTAPFSIPPDKTVTGEEKPASDLAKKAQAIAQGVRNLAASLGKKAGTVGSDGKSVTPNMPPNTQVNEGTTPGGKNKPPSGGTFSGTNNPDANAKTAGTPAAGAKAAGSSMAAEGKDDEKKVSLPAGDSKGNIPDSKNNTDTTKTEGGQAAVQSKGECQDDKMAAAGDFVIDSSYHLKLASLLLSTEEGRLYAQRMVEKAHGAEAASDIVKAASIMEERAQEIAELEASGAQEAEQLWKSASVEDRQKIVKLARVHATARSKYKTEVEKQAYDAGAMGAAQMGDAGMLGGAGAGVGPEAGGAGAPAGLPPEAAAAMAGGAPGGAEGGMPPGADAGAAGGAGGAPGGGEELSAEAVVAALDQMVSSGELPPELAAQILQQILGGGAEGGAGGAGGGMPGVEAGGAPGGMPPGAAAGGMPPGAAPAGAAPGGEADKGGAEKKEPAEKKESPKEESEEKKEAALLKRAHEIARAAIVK